MRRIAIINQKGGCGKTTTAINLAGVFAARSLRTLLVDMDPQSHCAAGLAIPEGRIDLDVGDAMLHAHPERLDRARLLWRISRNLDLLPSRMKLAGIEASRGGLSEHADRHTRLSRLLDTLLTGYDTCCIDCPPSIGLLTFNALTAATEILIPVETSYFSLQGAAKQVATIRSLGKRLGSRAEYWLVPTIHDESSALAKDLLEELHRRFGDRLAPVVIRSDSALKEAASFGQPVIEYNASSRGSEDYIALAEWLQSKSTPRSESVSTPLAAMGTNRLPRAVNSSPPVVTVSPPANVERAMASKLACAPIPASPPLASPVQAKPTSILGASIQREPTENGGPDAPSARSSAYLGARPDYKRSLATAFQLRARVAVRKTVNASESLHESDETPSSPHLPHGVSITDAEATFVQPLGSGNRIAIAGDFNGWSPQAHVMRRDNHRGVYQIQIPLAPGERHYRLVIDGRWTHDPYNERSELSPFGEKISVVEVARAAPTIHTMRRLVTSQGAD